MFGDVRPREIFGTVRRDITALHWPMSPWNCGSAPRAWATGRPCALPARSVIAGGGQVPAL